ncbi:MAG: glycosyltransferase [Candidatus Micrarchaeales archaeon]
MFGLTTLIFSKDDVEQTLGLIRNMHKLSDEIILIDSSSSKNSAAIKKGIKKMKVVRYFYTIALGYPDPMRMYALKQCKFDWVLLIDTDERLSPLLYGEIKNIISKSECDAYSIKRYEGVGKQINWSNFTWQTRLFRKNKVSFTGMLHEQAKVEGRLCKLGDDNHYLEHHSSLLHTASSVYEQLYKYDRFTYGIYNRKMLEYLSKVLVPEVPIEKTLSGSVLLRALLAYEKVSGKLQHQELSKFDYNSLYLFRNILYAIKEHGILGIPKAFDTTSKELDEFYKHMSGRNGKEAFEISIQLNRIGLIKYLRLDSASRVKKLNQKYKAAKQGIPLLVKLLNEEHKARNGKA